MQLETRSSPQDKAFAFLEESDRRLADEAPASTHWKSYALMIAAIADGGTSASDGTAEHDPLSHAPFGVSTDTRN
ncbi:hypothetical protein [Streptomyces sp. NBC_00271]|uniref:hypothetical protein n=1 Tax=Streptomyces sp. NBC_00271 TaxID=2975697 RepID=UPI002E2D3422|nr:hypothetical protein [Streptomyces sp. NBC_00271]